MGKCNFSGPDKSLPVRGAWIEIEIEGFTDNFALVAPRKGSVD